MTPAHVEARYRNLLAAIPRGHQASMNTMRELIDAAQLTRFERGEIWRYGVRHKYLTALDHWEPSTAPLAKGRHVRTYRRTSKPVRA
jgi:hypothetical protein